MDICLTPISDSFLSDSVNIPEHIDALKAQREMYQALKARREALEESLRKRTEELKLLCIKEGELTGKLPIETPLAPGEQPPQIRRRVGTAFSLSTKKDDDDQVSNIELEYELQKQITSAAHKLSQDKSVSKYVRKQRRQSFHRAQTKLKEMEKKLHDSQREAGLAELTPTTPSYDGRYSCNDSLEYSLDDCLSQSCTEDYGKKRFHSSITSRLYKSFRYKYSYRHKLNKSCYDLDSSISSANTSSFLDDEAFDRSALDMSPANRASWHTYCYEKVLQSTPAIESQV